MVKLVYAHESDPAPHIAGVRAHEKSLYKNKKKKSIPKKNMSAAPAAEGATPGLLPHRGPSISRMARKWDCGTGPGSLQRRGRRRYRQQADDRSGAAGPKYVIFDLAYGALHRAEYLQYFPLALKQKSKNTPCLSLDRAPIADALTATPVRWRCRPAATGVRGGARRSGPNGSAYRSVGKRRSRETHTHMKRPKVLAAGLLRRLELCGVK